MRHFNIISLKSLNIPHPWRELTDLKFCRQKKKTNSVFIFFFGGATYWPDPDEFSMLSCDSRLSDHRGTFLSSSSTQPFRRIKSWYLNLNYTISFFNRTFKIEILDTTLQYKLLSNDEQNISHNTFISPFNLCFLFNCLWNLGWNRIDQRQ